MAASRIVWRGEREVDVLDSQCDVGQRRGPACGAGVDEAHRVGAEPE